MEGGIRAWQGLIAEGAPEAGIAWFAVGSTAADMAALAWTLEENTRLFYTALAGMRPGTDEADLFLSLVDAEEHHKKTLETVHGRLTDQPVERFYRDQATRILEGGIAMDEALKWAEGKSAREVLTLAMGLEANAYDRYLKMMEKSLDDDSRDVFETVATEERGHLKGLAALMDEVIGLEEDSNR
jgi:rubrerythrin